MCWEISALFSMIRTKSFTTPQYSGKPTLPVPAFEADFSASSISFT
jgi:hypothetical protein